MMTCRCPDGCNGCEIMSLEDIVKFLLRQGELRSAENDEGGCIVGAAMWLAEDLEELADTEGNRGQYADIHEIIKAYRNGDFGLIR